MWSYIKSHLLRSLCLCRRSSNTSPWAFLPDEILIEILSRLPAKSLIRFQCVSKSWRALISQHLHDKLPRPMAGLFTWTANFIGLGTRTCTASIDTSLSFLPYCSPRLHVIDCCNGLLLLSDLASLYVCNPATRRWARISNPRPDARQLVLAFHPCSSTHFKIVSFPARDGDLLRPWGFEEVQVFSSETGEWRDVSGISGLDRVCFANTRIAFLNGTIFIMDAYYGLIFAVNIEGRYCQLINWPDDLCPNNGMYAHCFGLSGGQLHSAFMHGGEVHLWVLLNDGSRCNNGYVWKHRKSIRAIKLPHGEVVKCSAVPVCVEAFHPDLDLIFLRCRGKLFSYRWQSAKVEVVCNAKVEKPFFAYSPCSSEDLDLQM